MMTKRPRPLHLGLLLAALAMPLTALIPGSPMLVHAESLKPEVQKPLAEASSALQKRDYRKALAKIAEADKVGGKSAYDNYRIDQMRGAAAFGAGDVQTAIRSYEAVLAFGGLPQAEKLQTMEALVGAYYRIKDYGKTQHWANRYAKEGGRNPQITGLTAQLKLLSGDSKGAARELAQQVEADVKAGRTPAETRLQLLANAYLRDQNMDGYVTTIARLAQHYGKKNHWAEALKRLPRKNGFSERLNLDVFRLKDAVGVLDGTKDYMEYAQLALQEGLNAEGLQIIDKGMKAGALGVGAEAERHKRLQALAQKRKAESDTQLAQRERDAAAAADGGVLLEVGEYLFGTGQTAKGLSLMEQAVKKGGMRRPDDAKLRLGIAYIRAGQKAKAFPILKSVQGTDGTGDLAQLWAGYARQN